MSEGLVFLQPSAQHRRAEAGGAQPLLPPVLPPVFLLPPGGGLQLRLKIRVPWAPPQPCGSRGLTPFTCVRRAPWGPHRSCCLMSRPSAALTGGPSGPLPPHPMSRVCSVPGLGSSWAQPAPVAGAVAGPGREGGPGPPPHSAQVSVCAPRPQRPRPQPPSTWCPEPAPCSLELPCLQTCQPALCSIPPHPQAPGSHSN